ncbi:MAG: hypothetical protein HQ549_01640 [Candidatus Omnitrophica bacterium]|nr:hypothetical protein [Candidatus Omnitrophota bacterium]
MRRYLENNRDLVKILLIYFFLTFVMGYIDFDRRVLTFERSTQALESVVKGDFNPPMNHRILVPYTVYFFHKVSHISLEYSYALFRFLFYFLAFALFHMYLRKWFGQKTAMIGTLSLIASLPLTLTNWYSVPTDMPELIMFILGVMWIRDGKHKNLFILIPLASLNRETSIALVLIYFFNEIGKENWFVLIRRTAIYFLLWLIPSAILISIFGIRDLPGYFHHFRVNVAGLLKIFESPNPYNHFYFILYLCGFYWFLAFMNFRKKPSILKRALIPMTLFLLYGFSRGGAISEVRILIPFYVFIIPLGLFSLFGEEEAISSAKE